MKLGEKDAIEARETLRLLGLKQMEGSHNPRGEYWITEAMHPYFIPYGLRPPHTFVEEVFDDIVDVLT